MLVLTRMIHSGIGFKIRCPDDVWSHAAIAIPFLPRRYFFRSFLLHHPIHHASFACTMLTTVLWTVTFCTYFPTYILLLM